MQCEGGLEGGAKHFVSSATTRRKGRRISSIMTGKQIFLLLLVQENTLTFKSSLLYRGWGDFNTIISACAYTVVQTPNFIAMNEVFEFFVRSMSRKAPKSTIEKEG